MDAPHQPQILSEIQQLLAELLGRVQSLGNITFEKKLEKQQTQFIAAMKTLSNQQGEQEAMKKKLLDMQSCIRKNESKTRSRLLEGPVKKISKTMQQFRLIEENNEQSSKE